MKIQQDGMKLWVPLFLSFMNDEVHIVQQGFLWSSHLVVDSALPGGDEGCGSGCGGCGKRL